VVEAVRFLAGKGEDLLGSGSEVVHHLNELGLRFCRKGRPQATDLRCIVTPLYGNSRGGLEISEWVAS
jgi:hypothetical protein